MAIGYLGTVEAGLFSAATSISWSHTIAGNNNCLLVDCAIDAAVDPTVITATVGGVAMTKLTQFLSGGTWPDSVRFILNNISAGSKTVQVNYNSSALSVAASHLFDNVHPVTPWLAGSNLLTSGNGGASGLSVPSRAGGLVVDLLANNAAVWTPGAGQTKFYDHKAAGSPYIMGSYKTGTGSNVSMSWSGTSGRFHQHSVCLLPVGGGNNLFGLV